jgi:hypothetical protein
MIEPLRKLAFNIRKGTYNLCVIIYWGADYINGLKLLQPVGLRADRHAKLQLLNQYNPIGYPARKVGEALISF